MISLRLGQTSQLSREIFYYTGLTVSQIPVLERVFLYIYSDPRCSLFIEGAVSVVLARMEKLDYSYDIQRLKISKLWFLLRVQEGETIAFITRETGNKYGLLSLLDFLVIVPSLTLLTVLG